MKLTLKRHNCGNGFSSKRESYRCDDHQKLPNKDCGHHQSGQQAETTNLDLGILI